LQASGWGRPSRARPLRPARGRRAAPDAVRRAPIRG
jgi:hypothetical protein